MSHFLAKVSLSAEAVAESVVSSSLCFAERCSEPPTSNSDWLSPLARYLAGNAGSHDPDALHKLEEPHDACTISDRGIVDVAEQHRTHPVPTCRERDGDE